MERNVMEYISTLVEELGPQIAGPKAMTSLMNGYNGDTSICGVLGLWLAELKSMDGSIGGGNGSTLSRRWTALRCIPITMGSEMSVGVPRQPVADKVGASMSSEHVRHRRRGTKAPMGVQVPFTTLP